MNTIFLFLLVAYFLQNSLSHSEEIVFHQAEISTLAKEEGATPLMMFGREPGKGREPENYSLSERSHRNDANRSSNFTTQRSYSHYGSEDQHSASCVEEDQLALLNQRLGQAQEKLDQTTREAAAVRNHFDAVHNEWKIVNNLEETLKQYYYFEQQLALAFNTLRDASADFINTEQEFFHAWSEYTQYPYHPLFVNQIKQLLDVKAQQVQITLQTYESLIPQAMKTKNDYWFLYNQALQNGVTPGFSASKYGTLLDKAQLSANQVAQQLADSQRLVARIREEIARAAHSPKGQEPPITISSITRTSEKFEAPPESIQQPSALPAQEKRTSFPKEPEKLNEILDESLEQLLNQIKQQLLNNLPNDDAIEDPILPLENVEEESNSENDIAAEKLKEKKREETISIFSEELCDKFLNEVLAEESQKMSLSINSPREVKLHPFSSLLQHLSTDPSQEQIIGAQEKSRAFIKKTQKEEIDEMEKAFFEHDAKKKQEELDAKKKRSSEIGAAMWEEGKKILTYYPRQLYYWGSDQYQFIEDLIAVQIEAPKKTQEFFRSEGKNPSQYSITDYALAHAAIARELYEKRVAERYPHTIKAYNSLKNSGPAPEPVRRNPENTTSPQPKLAQKELSTSRNLEEESLLTKELASQVKQSQTEKPDPSSQVPQKTIDPIKEQQPLTEEELIRLFEENETNSQNNDKQKKKPPKKKK